MDLFRKFFNNLFYPFLFGIIITIIFVIVMTNVNTFNNIDLKTSKNIVAIEKKYSEININSVSVLLLNDIVKIQLGLQQQIFFYNELAEKSSNKTFFSKLKIQNYVHNYFDLREMNFTDINLKSKYSDNLRNETDFYASWFVDQYTTGKNLSNKNSNLYKHVLIYSYLIQSIYSFRTSLSDLVGGIHFYFESSNCLISFPYNQNLILNESIQNPPWCTDENGNLYTIFNFKCYFAYELIQLANDNIFDMNNEDQLHRKIYIFNAMKKDTAYFRLNYVMCIKFNDSLSGHDAYICADIYKEKLFNIFEDFNRLLKGYFVITSVGFKTLFYHPLMAKEPYNTISELLYKWTKTFYLTEKMDFFKNVQTRMTSNYIRLIDIEQIKQEPMELFNNIKLDNTIDHFYLNGEKIYFNIYPILLENYDKQYEHVMSIVHLYNKSLYYDNMKSYQDYNGYNIIPQILLFSLFAGLVLYIIILSMKSLAKYIVIPIKNVQYMIKGINIGGVNRIEYLNYLKQKQEENLIQLKKSYELEILNEENNNLKFVGNNITTSNLNLNLNPESITQNETKTKNMNSSNLIKDKDKDKDGDENVTTTRINNTRGETTDLLIEKENREILHKLNRVETGSNSNNILNFEEQFNQGCEKLEKETAFYDFNEEFLQYRPVEINELEKSLLDLKDSLLLTSKDNKPDKIIEYSNSEAIFSNFKNKGGIRLCQSNIGNLLSQLHKYNQAIYHLVLSIQCPLLKKYLSKTIQDELDEKDALLNLIDQNYNKNSKREYKNKLVEKQINNSHNTFSQKEIHKYINERYNKLIFIYYKFFSMIKKSDNISQDLNGLFLHKDYHTINFYHKILIQYIFLCFTSSDIIKTGESILDYIEFMIKFKLKPHNPNERRDYNRNTIDYFDKIVSWFNLMDNYIDFVTERTNLANDKIILDNYSNKLSSNDNIYNYLNDSSFLFKANMQRNDFLKGKFAIVCQNYDDALFYLIRASKKQTIVLDGLIKKKALKRIMKILLKMQKFLNQKEEDIPIKDVFSNCKHLLDAINKSILERKKEETDNELSVNDLDSDSENIENCPSDIMFNNGIKMIINEVNKDIEECNIKQIKDVIIILDRNFCNDEQMLKSFIEEIKIIIQNNVSQKDRLCFVYLEKQYYILCPLNKKKNIDIQSLYNDLNSKIHKKNDFNAEMVTFIGDKASNFFFEKKISIKSGKELNMKEFEEEEEEMEEDEDNSKDSNISETKDIKPIITRVINFLSFFVNYSIMKENENNERYIVLFSNLFNEIKNNFHTINEEFDKFSDENLHLLIVGKLKKYSMDIKRAKQIINNVILRKFGIKSEFVEFENIKKIKTILSSNNSVVDDIIFPNEIYG